MTKVVLLYNIVSSCQHLHSLVMLCMEISIGLNFNSLIQEVPRGHFIGNYERSRVILELDCLQAWYGSMFFTTIFNLIIPVRMHWSLLAHCHTWQGL